MIRNRPALLTALNFLSYIDRLVLPAVLASVEKELALSKTAAGLGAPAFLIGYFAPAPFFGARADKGRRKGLIAAGVMVWSLATALTGLAVNIYMDARRARGRPREQPDDALDQTADWAAS